MSETIKRVAINGGTSHALIDAFRSGFAVCSQNPSTDNILSADLSGFVLDTNLDSGMRNLALVLTQDIDITSSTKLSVNDTQAYPIQIKINGEILSSITKLPKATYIANLVEEKWVVSNADELLKVIEVKSDDTLNALKLQDLAKLTFEDEPLKKLDFSRYSNIDGIVVMTPTFREED